MLLVSETKPVIPLKFHRSCLHRILDHGHCSERIAIKNSFACFPRTSQGTRIGILLSRDLIFTTKVKTTAHSLGYHIFVIGDVSKAKAEIKSLHPSLVLIDLMAGELCTPSAISEYVAIADPDIWLVAFGPHVDSESLAGAHEPQAAKLFSLEVSLLLTCQCCFSLISADCQRHMGESVNWKTSTRFRAKLSRPALG